MGEVKAQLQRAEENFHLLHEIAEKGVLQLKYDVLSVEKQCSKDKEDFSAFMDSTVERIRDVMKTFETSFTEEKDREVGEIRTSCEQKVEEYQSKLEVETNKLTDAYHEIEVYQRNLNDTKLQVGKFI